MTFQDIVDLAQGAESIPLENIQFAVFSDQNGYLSAQRLSDGTYVFAPFYGKTRLLAKKLFGSATPTQ